MASKADPGGIGDALEDLFAVLMERKQTMADESYVALLFKKGEDAILKKIAEEAGEVIIASKGQEKEKIIHEIVDLWFHSMVLMGFKDISFDEIAGEFRKRMGIPGIAEKKSRKKH